MKETTAEAAEAIERTIDALWEAEKARADYDAWMAAWRARNGHHGPYDTDTGLPLSAKASAGVEGA